DRAIAEGILHMRTAEQEREAREMAQANMWSDYNKRVAERRAVLQPEIMAIMQAEAGRAVQQYLKSGLAPRLTLTQRLPARELVEPASKKRGIFRKSRPLTAVPFEHLRDYGRAWPLKATVRTATERTGSG